MVVHGSLPGVQSVLAHLEEIGELWWAYSSYVLVHRINRDIQRAMPIDHEANTSVKLQDARGDDEIADQDVGESPR